MADAAMGCQEFPVEWDPLRLFTLEGFGEETEWLPMPPDVLLQHATDGDNGCVDARVTRIRTLGYDTAYPSKKNPLKTTYLFLKVYMSRVQPKLLCS